MIEFKCGCGQYNRTLDDWVSHFRYRGFGAGVKLLLKTRMEWDGQSYDLKKVSACLVFSMVVTMTFDHLLHIRSLWVMIPVGGLLNALFFTWWDIVHPKDA